MKCPQCDALIADDCIFCPKCGERLQGLGAESFAELRESAGQDSAAGALTEGPQQAGLSSPAAGPGAQAGRAPATAGRAAAAAAADNAMLWTGQYSLRGMIDVLFLAALATIGAIAIAVWWQAGRTGWLWLIALIAIAWGFVFAVYAVRRLRHRYRLTSQTLLHEHGLLLKSTSPIEIIRIDDIVMNQSLLERLVGVGTIRILSNDTTDSLLVMKGIPNVRRAFEIIDRTRRDERRRRAVRVDAV